MLPHLRLSKHCWRGARGLGTLLWNYIMYIYVSIYSVNLYYVHIYVTAIREIKWAWIWKTERQGTWKDSEEGKKEGRNYAIILQSSKWNKKSFKNNKKKKMLNNANADVRTLLIPTPSLCHQSPSSFSKMFIFGYVAWWWLTCRIPLNCCCKLKATVYWKS